MSLFYRAIPDPDKENYDKIKVYLQPKDGKVHIIMLSSSYESSSGKLECNGLYSVEIDSIINLMQDDGYEILDINFAHHSFEQIRSTYGYDTLITYK